MTYGIDPSSSDLHDDDLPWCECDECLQIARDEQAERYADEARECAE